MDRDFVMGFICTLIAMTGLYSIYCMLDNVLELETGNIIGRLIAGFVTVLSYVNVILTINNMI